MTTTTPRARAAETCRQRRAQERRARWNTRIILRTGSPPWDDDGLLPSNVRDGDWRAALDDTITEICSLMTIEPSEDETPLLNDVALFHQGRLLAVVQYSLDGPVVTRLEPQVLY
jgi:hypothetical protein